MTISAGTKLGRYKIGSKIGEGGMGEVYQAEDMKLDRKVALKILPAQFASDPDRLRRFAQEAKAAAALNHPNIAHIYEVGHRAGVHFIAMEFLDGVTLRQLIHDRQTHLPKLLRYLQYVAEGVSKAHAAGIVHRDIKPDNIMLTHDGHVKILDFGLAKLIEPGEPEAIDPEAPTRALVKTDPGAVMGTAIYMSPEQARGLKVDARTDIFSLGVLIYEAVAGRLPFDGTNANEIVAGILGDKEPPPLARYASNVPTELERIVSKALRKDPDERYQTVKDLLLDLKSLRQSLEFQNKLEGALTASVKDSDVPAASAATVLQRPRSTVAGTSRRALTRPGIAVAAVLVLVIAVAAAYLYVNRAGARAINSIAVLPFTNANADPETDFLVDGMTDNIIERLSQLPNFKVMSHTAVFHYKGREIDPRTIGNELGVEAVLTGRFTKRNDTLNISLELVNAKDNSHIWGEQYDRKLSELLALQGEIPLDVSDKLKLKLSGESKERLARVYTDNAEAYQLYLKGRYSWEKWSSDGAKQAVGFFEEAIRKDPNYALAYAGLADVMMFGRFKGAGLSQKDAHRRGREEATKALLLDPQLGEAHAALAEVLIYENWDFAGAEREFKLALELNPSYGEGHHEYSHLLLLLGRIDESLAESKRFLELDPVSEAPIGHLCYHYLYARQYDEAITQCRKDIELYPDTPQGYELADAYYHKGMFRESFEAYLGSSWQDETPPDVIAEYRKAYAQSGMSGFYRYWLERLKTKSPDESPVEIAELHARLGEKDQAFEWLEKAYAAHHDGMVRLKEELGFDNLRSDPRFADLLRRVGLPE